MTCPHCPRLRRLFCLVACAEMNEIFNQMEEEMAKKSSRQQQQNRHRSAAIAITLLAIAAAYALAGLQIDSEAHQREQLQKMRAIADIEQSHMDAMPRIARQAEKLAKREVVR